MKLAIVLLLATAAGAQVTTDKTTGCFADKDGKCATTPSRCPQYQHDAGFRGMQNCKSVPGSEYLMQCEEVPPLCVDDLHTVTEREWQELQDRLSALKDWNLSLSVRVNELLERVKKLEAKEKP